MSYCNYTSRTSDIRTRRQTTQVRSDCSSREPAPCRSSPSSPSTSPQKHSASSASPASPPCLPKTPSTISETTPTLGPACWHRPQNIHTRPPAKVDEWSARAAALRAELAQAHEQGQREKETRPPDLNTPSYKIVSSVVMLSVCCVCVYVCMCV